MDNIYISDKQFWSENYIEKINNKEISVNNLFISDRDSEIFSPLTPNAKSQYAHPALVYVIKQKNAYLIDLFLSQETDLDIKNTHSNNALLTAIIEKNDALVEYLLSKKVELNLVTSVYPYHALGACLEKNNNFLLAQLLELGINPELNLSMIGFFKAFLPLYQAAIKNNVEACHLLIDFTVKKHEIIEKLEYFELSLNTNNSEKITNRHLIIDYINSQLEADNLSKTIIALHRTAKNYKI